MEKLADLIAKFLAVSDSITGRRLAKLTIAAVLTWAGIVLWERRDSVGVIVASSPLLLAVVAASITILIVGLWIESIATKAQAILAERITELENELAEVKTRHTRELDGLRASHDRELAELKAKEAIFERRLQRLLRQVIRLGQLPDVTGLSGLDSDA